MTDYLVNDIYPTVQGEGVQTGVPMVLVRMHGCPVGCPWCDTKETWVIDRDDERKHITDALGPTPQYARMTAGEIGEYITLRHPGFRWVLVTGGEPAMQPLSELVQTLHERGYLVAVETSGTHTGHLFAGFDWVCVSPKVNMPGGYPVLGETLRRADEIKHVVGKQQDVDNLIQLLETHAVDDRLVVICLQPVSQSAKATALCLDTVMSNGRWRLSLQTHKFISVR